MYSDNINKPIVIGMKIMNDKKTYLKFEKTNFKG